MGDLNGRELKVVVADDHRTFAGAVAMRLDVEPDIKVVDVTTYEDVVTASSTTAAADILVTDVEVGGLRALDVAAQARQTNQELCVVVLTTHEEPETAIASLRSGANSFLTKDTTVEDLVAAIRGTASGETWVSPGVLTGVLRLLLAAPARLTPWEERMVDLTTREREVLACMVAGMNRSAIAATLFLSPNTVRTHTQRVLAKLGVHSSLEAVAVALRAGVRPHQRVP